jgi:nitrogen-specific signal transduction histidine kinase/ActR/RegA family two-component response regulator
LTVESRWTLICDEENRPRAILVINTDVTEKKQLQARFLRAQRMESIGALAGGIAHDLNNILHPISLSMEMFRAHFPDTADRGMLDLVLASVERATSLIRQVLTFARGSEGERVAIPASTLVSEIETIVRATFPKTITFESHVDADIWPVRGDATQLHQVLLNLCVNARDAMADGGSLFFTAGNAKVDELQAAMQSEAASGRYVAFVVTDTGTGIPASIREKIFDPFFTTKEQGKGSGLGLATSLGIIRSHNGFITVDSTDGLGTTFRVFVPAAETAESAEGATSGTGIADLHGNGELILVVDDEAPILTALRATLERFGYQVLCANDGAEGVRLYAQNETKPAVVLTDICMPHMNGVALIGALKRLDPHVKVIATTGMTTVANTDAIHQLGVERFISKPFDSQTVLRALKQILAASSLHSGSPPKSISHNA